MRNPGIQHLRPRDYSDMQEQVLMAIWHVVFEPAVQIIREADPARARFSQIQNAPPTALETALQSGRVQYTKGVFSGNFNAQIAVEIRRMGGRYDKHAKVYFIRPEDVPAWVKASSEGFRSKAKKAHEEIVRQLDKTKRDIQRLIEAQPIDAEETIERIQDGFKTAADAISVSPVITTDSKRQLASEYSTNMKLYIKDFSESAIESLRDVVEDNAMQGYRFDRLTDMIHIRYGVTKRKAEFLARQETALFMSKYRELRFKEGGVERYVWHTAHDERVRQSHKELDGRTFFYDKKAPVQYFSTGTPCNPGEDFNCRCVDSPVIEKVAVAA